MTNESWQELESVLKSPFVVAVGECGLDFNRNFSEPETQINVFTRQLDLAAEYDLPVYLHERDASQQMLSILHQYRGAVPKMLLHCFTGTEEELQHYLELDLYIGITGWVCDERRNEALLDALPLIPYDRMMIETDAPYLLPRTLTTKPKNDRNEPAYLLEIAKRIAEERGLTYDVVGAVGTLNSVEFFGWPVDVHSITRERW